MKLKLTLLAFFAATIGAIAQSKNNISFSYGVTSSFVNIYGAIGDFGYTNKSGLQYGLNYTYSFNRFFSLQSGLMYSKDNVELSSIYPGLISITDGNIQLITVPVIAKLSFFKFFFADGGFLADFETNAAGSNGNQANYVATKQSGIGTELGLGAQYNWKHLNIFVNPFLQNHAMIKFSNDRSNFTLFDSGFKFGVGYNF